MALLKKQGCTKELQARIAPEPVEASEDRWLRAGRGSCGVHTTRRGSRAGARGQQLLTDTETMAASLRDRARMSTGGGTTERETAQVFAGYDHEEELLAGGAGAAGDLARLSESLQEKEVAAGIALQEVQEQLDGLKNSLAMSNLKYEVADALGPHADDAEDGLSKAGQLALPQIEGALAEWWPKLGGN